MRITIVYDTVYGNTAAIAKAIAEGLAAAGHDVRLATVQEAQHLALAEADLVIVGSPTRGFRPTPNISEFVGGLDRVSERAAAAFDTRLDLETVNPAPLRWVVDAGGYAAARIGGALEQHGYRLKARPEGFLVTGTEGPLKAGEIERARAWGQTLLG